MKITVDSRDRDLISVFKAADLEQKNDYILKQLKVGDIQAAGCVIERKRADDLVGSIKDGRVFNQALNMSYSDDLPFLIVVGTLEEWMPQWNRYSNFQVKLDDNLIYGAMASMMTRYGISCAWVPDDLSLCRLALKIFQHAEDNKVGVPARVQIMIKSRDRRLDVLKLLFGLSEKQSAAILERGKTLLGVMQLPKEQITSIPGLGEITAKKIHELVMKEKPFSDGF